MTKSKFLPFVPLEVQERVELLKRIIKIAGPDKSTVNLLAICEKLCVHPNMEIVWGRLSKREVRSEEDWIKKNHLLQYCSNIYSALNRGAWDYLSESEKTIKRQEFLSMFEKLSAELEKFELFENAFNLFDDQELLNFQVPGSDMEDYDLDFHKEGFPVPLSLLMKRCVMGLEHHKPDPVTTLLQPNRYNADFIFFARRMANVNFNSYGLPLYEINALVSDIFFPDLNVTEKIIQNTLRGFDFRAPLICRPDYRYSPNVKE